MDLKAAMRYLRSPQGLTDPFPAFAALHELGPSMRLNRRVGLAVGYNVVSEMMRDPRMLLDGTISLDRYVRDWRDHPSMVMMANSLHSVNAPDHPRVRRLFKQALSGRRVERMGDLIEARARDLADALTSGSGPVDFVEDFAVPMPLHVFCELIGVPQEDGDWLRPRWEELVAVQNMKFDKLADADQATTELRAYFSELVEKRRANPTQDVVTALVDTMAETDGTDMAVSLDELIANLVLLLMAGWETVANMLTSGMYLMMTRPELAEQLRHDPSIAGAFVEEVLRMESPIQWTMRWVESDETIMGLEIPANTHVQFMLAAANRDPARFEDPDTFKLDRDGPMPLAFGAGPHLCLGSQLAGIEGRVAFPLLATHLSKMKLADEPVRLDRPAQRGFTKMPLAFAT